MKDEPLLQRVVGTSHERLSRVDVHDGDTGVVVGTLEVSGGTVTGSAVEVDRWSASLEVSGPEWIPRAPGDPLSGLSRYWLTVHMGATVDTEPVLVPVARVIPAATRVEQSVDGVTISVECIGPAGWLDTATGPWVPKAGESCQAMITRIVQQTDPPSWYGAVRNDTAPVAIPADYEGNETAWATIEDLAAFADLVVYFDAESRLVIGEPLPVTTRAKRRARPVSEVAATIDLVSFDAEMGRTRGFANAVEITFESNNPDQEPIIGRASQTTGPLAVGRVGQVTYRETRNGRPSQAQADARAVTLVRATLLAWRLTGAEIVPDPRLEPGDVVTLTLPDRTEKTRVSTVEIPLNADAAMRVGLRSYE